MTILSILAATLGSLMVLASLPQIYKIFKRKSAKDISAISYSCFTINNVVWILYGIELGSYAVILSNALSAITCVIVLLGWYLYGK